MAKQGAAKPRDESVKEEIERLAQRFDFKLLLQRLIIKPNVKGNRRVDRPRAIVWATDAYAELGNGFQPTDEITLEKILELGDELRPRAFKEKDERDKRVRERAEVFTPARICAQMNEFLDEEWFGRKDVFTRQTKTGWKRVGGEIQFQNADDWKKYVKSTRLEIACGEAPFIVSRRDAANGAPIPLKDRVGILDRKLRVVTERAGKTPEEWLEWATYALKSVYGYELQGDSLLLARLNVFATLLEHFDDRFDDDERVQPLASDKLEKFAKIVAYNFWQMDGLTNAFPVQPVRTQSLLNQPAPKRKNFLFADATPSEKKPERKTPPPAQPPPPIYVSCWNKNTPPIYRLFDPARPMEERMKFDFVIGNPPYQEDMEDTSDNPVYHFFIDASYEIGNRVLLITPGRVRFVGGETPSTWNRKMLSDTHLKVEVYEPNSRKIFPDRDIKGGIAITYRSVFENFGAIDIYFAFPELKGIYEKTVLREDFTPLDDHIYNENLWNLEILYRDHPEFKSMIGSGGRERRLTSPILTTLPIFSIGGGVTTVLKLSA